NAHENRVYKMCDGIDHLNPLVLQIIRRRRRQHQQGLARLAVRDERHLHLHIWTEPTGCSAFHIGFDSRKESVSSQAIKDILALTALAASPSMDAKFELTFRSLCQSA